jgi:hypothetical protein
MKRRCFILVLAACSAGFAFGLVQLFRLRFAAGDVYPAYSSLRADPLGAMALYESLARMPGLTVRRDFNPGNELPDGKGTAYLHLAGSTWNWTGLPEDFVRQTQHFLAGGGRLVVTFFPETAKPRRPRFDDEPGLDSPPKKKTNGDKSARKKKPGQTEPQLRRAPPSKWWGVEFAFAALEPGEGDAYQPVTVVRKAGLALPETLEWHSATVLTNLDKSWHTIYARGTNPVVVERKFGSGTVVLATDSYFVSNEALRQERPAEFLAWLVGPGRQVVFDEAHFGIVDTSGVASLIRKYRLHGLAVGLLVLAGLFLWQNSVRFVPPPPEERDPGYVAGKEAAAGFVNLLRRNVPPREVLQTCLAEWKKSFARGARPPGAKIMQAQAALDAHNALPRRQRDPVRAYREICGILKAGRGPGPNPVSSPAPNPQEPERRPPSRKLTRLNHYEH